MFGTDIRTIIPQLAMSAGTMVACACKEIVMGKQSSLGPIDPQIGGMPAHGILEEFRQARESILADPSTIPLWQPILAQYDPTLVGDCQKAVDLSAEMVKEWLVTGMFSGTSDALCGRTSSSSSYRITRSPRRTTGIYLWKRPSR
jgi:hypothetical protein